MGRIPQRVKNENRSTGRSAAGNQAAYRTNRYSRKQLGYKAPSRMSSHKVA